MRGYKLDIAAIPGALIGGRQGEREPNPDLVRLVGRGIGSIAVVQARDTREGGWSREDKAIFGPESQHTAFTNLLAKLLQAEEVFQAPPKHAFTTTLGVGRPEDGLALDLEYSLRGETGSVPYFSLGLNATTGEVMLHCYPNAPVAGPEIDVVGVPGMLDALDTDLIGVQLKNNIQYARSPFIGR